MVSAHCIVIVMVLKEAQSTIWITDNLNTFNGALRIKIHITAFPMFLFYYSVLIFFRLVLIPGWEKWSTETCWIPALTCMKMPSSRYTPWCTETLFQGFWTLRFISLLLKVLQALLLKLNFQTKYLDFFWGGEGGWDGRKVV